MSLPDIKDRSLPPTQIEVYKLTKNDMAALTKRLNEQSKGVSFAILEEAIIYPPGDLSQATHFDLLDPRVGWAMQEEGFEFSNTVSRATTVDGGAMFYFGFSSKRGSSENMRKVVQRGVELTNEALLAVGATKLMPNLP